MVNKNLSGFVIWYYLSALYFLETATCFTYFLLSKTTLLCAVQKLSGVILIGTFCLYSIITFATVRQEQIGHHANVYVSSHLRSSLQYTHLFCGNIWCGCKNWRNKEATVN